MNVTAPSKRPETSSTVTAMSHIGQPSSRLGQLIATFGNWPAWKKILTGISAVVVFVAAIAGIVQGVAVLVPKDETTTETIIFKAAAVPPETPTFAVPVTAQFETFPSASPACGPEQMNWLNTHGTPFTTSFVLRFRNTAKSGSNLAITDISSEGTTSDPDVPEISVSCINTKAGQGAATGTEHGQLDVGTNAIVTVSSATEKSSASGAAAKRSEPLSYTLPPGDHNIADVDLNASHNFRGHFIAKAASGTIDKKIIADSDDGSEFFVPAFNKTKDFAIVIVDGVFECQDKVNNVETGGSRKCDFAEIQRHLDSALK